MSKGSGGTRTARPANNVNATGGQQGASRIAGIIASAESSIRENRFETAFAWDESGKQVYAKVGGKDYVDVRDVPENTIVTHNHPSGTSFSQGDVEQMIRGNYKELRAVGKDYTYTLKRPETGWPISTARATIEFARARAKAKVETDRYFFAGVGNSRARAATLAISDLTMKYFSKSTGIEYTRKHV